MGIEFYSSRSPSGPRSSLKEVVMQGQAADGGLFVPTEVPRLSPDLLAAFRAMSQVEIVEQICEHWLAGSVDAEVARQLAREVLTFKTDLVSLNTTDHVLELFHGPTLAFKDYGARFMAKLLSYFLESQGESQTILVATSGDTGSAVAAGFLGLPNVRVVVLYPSGRVSALQEKQMTTLGHNVTALEVNGSFDDCQALVKAAFRDDKLKGALKLNAANSINFARLIAQTFYYFLAWAKLYRRDKAPVFSVPSGNLGNLTAGVLAMRMGLPVHRFVAATNLNDVFVNYLASGRFEARPSLHSMSNAMDVGNPSNLERLKSLYGDDLALIKKDIVGFAVTEAETAESLRRAADRYGYIIDPHGAVALEGLRRWRLQSGDEETPGIVLATAHPAKFQEDVERWTGRSVLLPPELLALKERKKHAVWMENSFEALKKWLIG